MNQEQIDYKLKQYYELLDQHGLIAIFNEDKGIIEFKSKLKPVQNYLRLVVDNCVTI